MLIASSLLFLALSAAPAPRALPNADTIVHVPRLDAAKGTIAFFEAAGERSPLVSPASWGGHFHPFFQLRPGKREDLESVGLDPNGPLTVSLRGDDRMTCAQVSDSALHARKAELYLTNRGRLVKRKEAGAAVTFAQVGKRAESGYAIKGKVVCAFSSLSMNQAVLAEAARAVSKPLRNASVKQVQKLPGDVQVITERGVAAFGGSASQLDAHVVGELDLPPVRTGRSPFAAMKPSGILFARGQLAPKARKQWLTRALSYATDACASCRIDPGTLAAVLDQHLTGNFVFRANALELGGKLSTNEARYSAVKHALLFEVKNPSALRKALGDTADRIRGINNVDGELQIPLATATVRMGVNPEFLYLANDEAALDALMAIERGAGGKLAHGVEYVVDPDLLQRALGRVSLLDAFTSKELAAFFAMTAEIGPLLRATRSIEGWVDSERSGAHRAFMKWVLE